MTINLEDWVGKKVKVTLRSSLTKTVTVEKCGTLMYYNLLNLGIYYNSYIQDGRNYHYSFSTSSYDIVKIEEIVEIQMNTKELQAQIEETQKQLSNLQEKLKEAEKQEMGSKDYYPCFKDGSLIVDNCLEAIDRHSMYLSRAFDWSKTQQGYDYWAEKSRVPLTDEDKITILRWCVNYYRSQG